MKATGIVASPRIGNTTYLVKEALGILQGGGIETELIHLKKKEIRPCNGHDKFVLTWKFSQNQYLKANLIGTC